MASTLEIRFMGRGAIPLTIGLIVAGATAIGRVSLADGIPAKWIAAPPDEFLNGALRLPEPAQTGRRSRSAVVPIRFEAGADGFQHWEAVLPVDTDGELSLMLLAPESHRWEVLVQPPDGPVIRLRDSNGPVEVSRREGTLTLGGVQEPLEAFVINSAQAGPWRFAVARTDGQARSQRADGYLALASESPYRLYTHLQSFDLVAGRDVGVIAYLYDGRAVDGDDEIVPAPLEGCVDVAEAHLTLPGGEQAAIPLHDDGHHGDGAAGDGVFGGLRGSATPGTHIARVVVRGRTPEGRAFIRSGQHVFPVVEGHVVLAASAAAVLETQERVRIDVHAEIADGPARFLVFGELWGRDRGGSDHALCWLGGVAEPIPSGRFTALPLRCDRRWIDRQGTIEVLELRNVRVHDADTNIPLATLDAVGLKMDGRFSPSGNAADAITPEMLMGVPRGAAAALSENPHAESAPMESGGEAREPCSVNTLHRVMLVHGYCSGGVWPTGDFTDYYEFQDHDQNRSHDEFARLIEQQGRQLKSFGTIAHSQGGAASLHLYTYYWSGLDFSTGSRLIQSVGTPYQGTPLAGDLALLGQIFGAGCGTNFDMTYEGAALWLSGIPSWARSRVYYYTTSFEDDFGFDYCSLITDFFLDDPDDGVVERAYGQLPGASNMGHTEGWCHTTSMRDPAQYLDHGRNILMNALANR